MRRLCATVLLCGCASSGTGIAYVPAGPEVAAHYRGSAKAGRAWFEKDWVPGEASAAGGDGLGPMYNDTSCVGCHHQGGVGGAGPRGKNALILLDGSVSRPAFRRGPGSATTLLTQDTLALRGWSPRRRSIELEGRNTPALFGAGLIDQISEGAIRDNQLAVSKSTILGISGRRIRAQAGRAGRFGWKGDIGYLSTFIHRACAVEMGLTTPHRVQLDARARPMSGAKPDLTEMDVTDLTAFVATLPRPVDAPAAHPGRAVFEQLGCGVCHVPSLDGVDGLYSDLLLHDMGGELEQRASGSYGHRRSVRTDVATGAEWRTPPLWGVADTGPWLHDGRAHSLDAAIRAHGGEASRVTREYVASDAADRDALLAFLGELRAPVTRRRRGP